MDEKNQEKDRHAYCIMAHHEPELLRRLLLALDDSRNDIFVLVDAKADARQFNGLACERAHLFWTPRCAVYWGDLSFARAELLLFRSARQTRHHAYYHLLSGVDFPLKSQDEIRQFFKDHQGDEFVEFNASEKSREIARQRASYFYFFVRALKSKSAIRRRLSKWGQDALLSLQRHLDLRRNRAIDFHRGSNWISVTESFVDWLLMQETNIARIFSRTLCCDELFVQTLILRSPFVDRISPIGNLRKIDWIRGDPYCWRRTDLDELCASPCLFARKFSSSDIALIDELQKRL